MAAGVAKQVIVYETADFSIETAVQVSIELFERMTPFGRTEPHGQPTPAGFFLSGDRFPGHRGKLMVFRPKSSLCLPSSDPRQSNRPS
jgi:hypothetical protein